MEAYLRPLLEFAASVVPASQLSSTPIYLLATAGMRLLPTSQQTTLLTRTCNILRSYSFDLPDCSKSVRVISGEEEGLYGWIAVNYLMDGFDKHDHKAGKHSSTYGFLDMGGASTQIAFEPTEEERVKHADNLLEVKLRLLSGKDVAHPVFVTTWLGFGTNQARNRYVDAVVRAHLRTSDEAHSSDQDDAVGLGSERPVVLIDDPCLPKSLMLSESRHSGYTLRGTGDFAQCVRRTGPLLNKEVECLDQPCLFNGVHVPAIDFDVNHFIGISEYWYSTQDVWSMGGLYDFVEFERNAVEYCAREWKDIMEDHRTGAKWRSNVELSRLETQCFKAAWIINILHEGIGIPRLFDAGGEGDGKNQMEKAISKAEAKGFEARPPSFQSLNQVGDVAVSWTLGKMVLEVSKGETEGVKKGSSIPASAGPIFNPGEWSGHIPSFSGDLRSTLSDIKNADSTPFVGFAILALLFYLFCLSPASRRRKSFFSRRSDFAPLSTAEEGVLSDSSNGTRSPRPPNRFLFSTLTSPIRYSFYRLSSSLRTWGSRPSLLPTTRPPSSSSSDALPLRPRPLRPAISTPFLRTMAMTNIQHGNPAGGGYLDAPDVSERDKIARSHSTSYLPQRSPPSSRPTTPAGRMSKREEAMEEGGWEEGASPTTPGMVGLGAKLRGSKSQNSSQVNLSSGYFARRKEASASGVVGGEKG